MGKRCSRAAMIFHDHFGLLPGRPDRDSLFDISAAFGQLPWENLTKFLRKAGEGALPRMPEEVLREHVEHGAGGTCFSLTEALGEVLAFSGFRTRPVMGDMQHGTNIHCAVLVEMPGGENFLLDPGYLVREPVILDPGAETILKSGSETLVYRTGDDNSWDMFTSGSEGCRHRYRIKLAKVSRDRFRQFWNDSFDSPGMNGLHLSRAVDGVRLYAHNQNLRVVDSCVKRNVKLRSGYADRIAEAFGISRDIASMAWEELGRARCRKD